eukprot:1109185-Alexandrium_andersonii.AAC.1
MPLGWQCTHNASSKQARCSLFLVVLEPRDVAVNHSCGEVPARAPTAVVHAQCMRGPLFPGIPPHSLAA